YNQVLLNGVSGAGTVAMAVGNTEVHRTVPVAELYTWP
ncbi:MAG: hypothetical protein QOD45_498, partial [Pseudonocardiales bacterium]|nr:hypothetical protein [Pseudonocardiales bacterium]